MLAAGAPNALADGIEPWKEIETEMLERSDGRVGLFQPLIAA